MAPAGVDWIVKWNLEDACRFRSAEAYSRLEIEQAVLHGRFSRVSSMLTLGHS